jgi:hypothetical protein
MKLDKAKEVAAKLEELEKAQEQLTNFKNTKKSCKIRIFGEDDYQEKHLFSINHSDDELLMNKIREIIEESLEDKVIELRKELERM